MIKCPFISMLSIRKACRKSPVSAAVTIIYKR